MTTTAASDPRRPGMSEPLGRGRIPAVREIDGYVIRISDATDDPEWDDFLEETPLGSHTQTSCWGRARAVIGYRPIRVVISAEGRAVAGAQMERRALPIAGDAAFVTGGPVTSEDSSELAALAVREMVTAGRACGVRYLAVQPPPEAEAAAGQLALSGFRPGMLDLLNMYHPASIVLDLSPGLDEVFGGMSTSRRRNIRAGERHGIVVRLGSEEDLPVFDRLEGAHSARLGYDQRPPEYNLELWRALAPRGHVQLFMAEFEGEPVAAQLVIPFGDTCHHVVRVWSGEHAKLMACEVLEWETLKWDAAHGYRYADFGGIEQPVVDAVASGREDRIDPRYGAALFKLRWGAQVVANPAFLDYVYDPVLRFAYRSIPQGVMRSARLERLVKRLKASAP